MKTDSIRVLVDEELDYVVGGLSGASSSGCVMVDPAEISWKDIGVNSAGGGTDVDLGGAYAEFRSGPSISTHSYVEA